MTDTNPMTTPNEPVMRPLARVMPWPENPRRMNVDGLEELRESLRRVGLQDPIHVWERPDGDYILKGHRRHAAMLAEGWTECRQIVLHFDDERDAFCYLLEDHGHTVPLNNEEKITAVERGVALGLSAEELAPSLGMTEVRVQLYFDLGLMLPPKAREAVSSGAMSLHVAELLLKVEEKAERERATQMLLQDAETGEPLGFKAAQRLVECQFVMPRRWREKWEGLQAKLRKVKKVSMGYHYAAFDERRTYTLGENGQPEDGWLDASAPQPKDAEGRSVEEVALSLGVPVYVVPAPLLADGHVLLVSRRMLREAVAQAANDPAKEVQEELGRAADEEGQERGTEAAPPPKAEQAEDGQIEDEFDRSIRRGLAAVDEHLRLHPTLCMEQATWRPLLAFLAGLAMQMEADSTLALWRGFEGVEAADRWIREEKGQRSAMRCALLLLLCSAMDAADDPRQPLDALADVLGVDV